MSLLGRLSLAHRGWRYRVRVDPDEIRWMRGALRSGDVAVDVGAHKGAYTYWMRRCVGATGRVYAFEPQPEFAEYLRARAADFGWTNVSVEEVAVSSDIGSSVLLLPTAVPSPSASLVGASFSDEASRYEVSTTTLDSTLADRGSAPPVRLIKCDVEGHELAVLRGGVEVLRRQRPLVMLECEARHLHGGGMTDVFGFLERLGYVGFFFWKGRRRPVAEVDVRVHQVEGSRPYANNFIFAPPGGSA